MSDWHHSPIHRFGAAGAYMVTAGTLGKAHVFRARERLSLLRDRLLTLADEYFWNLQSWSIFSNHYHFIAVTENAKNLRSFLTHLHSETGREINRLDSTPDRQVWFNYWDTHLTFERSYLARLNYVQSNPVHHRLASKATDYPWCSASWFEKSADRSFVKTVASFKTGRVSVSDPFVPEMDLAV